MAASCNTRERRQYPNRRVSGERVISARWQAACGHRFEPANDADALLLRT
jgi:hypothetical protein